MVLNIIKHIYDTRKYKPINSLDKFLFYISIKQSAKGTTLIRITLDIDATIYVQNGTCITNMQHMQTKVYKNISENCIAQDGG